MTPAHDLDTDSDEEEELEESWEDTLAPGWYT